MWTQQRANIDNEKTLNLNGVKFNQLAHHYNFSEMSALFVDIYMSCAIRVFKLLFHLNANVYL